MKVTQVTNTRSGVSKAGKSYIVTSVILDDGKEAEALGTVVVGDEGTVTWDEKFQKFSFKKAFSPRPVGGMAKEFKADPVKNASIERQVALKAAIDIVSAKLPLMKEVPETKDIAEGVVILAEKFDEFLKHGGTNSPKVKTEGVPAETKPETKVVEEVPFTDNDIPADIDLENLEF